MLRKKSASVSHLTRPGQSTKLERVGDTEELAAAMQPQVVYDKVIEEQPEAITFEQPSWKQVKVVTMDLKTDSLQREIRKKNDKIILKASSVEANAMHPSFEAKKA